MSKYSKNNHTIYINDNGIEIPSVTTILKILNKPKLLKWVNYLGFKRQKYEDVLQNYSDIGVLVHYVIQCTLSNQPFNLNDIRMKCVNNAIFHIQAFKHWKDTHIIEPIMLEEQLVSERFGGTIDFYGKIDGKLLLLDFKTSKDFYSSMFLQLAGYYLLITEQKLIVDGIGIIIFNNNGVKEKIIISKDTIEKYVEVFNYLLYLFHSWFDLNECDNWGSILE